jgi:hypothetical protein
VSLYLSLPRAFKWRLVVADVNTPIIGVGFPSYYELLVDPRNKGVIDRPKLVPVINWILVQDQRR